MKFHPSRASKRDAGAAASPRSSTARRIGALGIVAAFYGFGAGMGCGSESANLQAPPPNGSDSGGAANDGGVDDSEALGAIEAGDGRPRHAPSSLRLGRDQDPRPGFVAGGVVIGKALDESDITAYRLYWGSDSATTLGPAIASLPKTGSDLSYELDASVPDGAAHLIALSANEKGEMSPGATTPAVDNFPVFADITVMADGGVGPEPSAVVDETNGKLLVAISSSANTGRLGLVHCDLDGTNCKLRDISNFGGAHSGANPSAVIDKTSGKLLVATETESTIEIGRLGFYSSNLDGSAAKKYTVLGEKIRGPSAVLDATNNKILVATTNEGELSDLSLLHRCDIATGQCSSKIISPAADQLTITRNPSAVLDEANGKVLVVAGVSSPAKPPRVFRCELDGTGCTFRDIPNFYAYSGWDRPLATVIDTVGRKLLVVGPLFGGPSGLGKLGLARCDLDTDADCTKPVDISAGQPEKSGIYPSAVIDAANGKLLVVAVSTDHFNKMGLFRCNLDGTSCTHTDISVGHEGMYDPSVVIDRANERLLVVANYPGQRLGLFSIGLW